MKFSPILIALVLFTTLTFHSCMDEAVIETEICNNNIDDDGDGLVDCDDPDCEDDNNCTQQATEICNNTIDDDGDGLIDCDDPDCSSDADCINVEPEICGNNLDDDGDGLIDCDDPDCIDFEDCIAQLEWSDVTTFNQRIEELKVFENKLFITGNFTQRDGATCYFSSVLSNNSFSNHTNLIGGSGISELTTFDNNLYGAGLLQQPFSNVGVVKWNGSSWDISGPNNENHNCIYTDGTTLYVGSGFGKVSYRTVNSSYEQFPVLPGEKYTSSITEYDGSIVVGGNFDNGIAKWNGSAWETLAGGTPGTIRKLLIYDNQLVAAGSFTEIGGQAITNLAIWDGSTWSSIGGSIPNSALNGVRDMLVHNGDLYVAGDFTQIGNIDAKYVARWNGSEWKSLNFQEGNEFDDFPLAIEVYNDKLFIGTASSSESHLYSLNF